MDRSAPAVADTEQVADSPPFEAQPPPAPEPAYPSRAQLARWLLVALALCGIGWLLWAALPTLSPFILGLVLAYLMLPFVNFLDRYTSRPMAIVIVYLIGILLLVTSFAYLIPLIADQIERLIASIPSVERLQEIGDNLLRQYRERVPDSLKGPVDSAVASALTTVQANVATYAQRAGSFLFGRVVQLLNTLTFLLGFIALPFWLFYVLSDEARGRAAVDRMLHPRLRPDFWNFWAILDRVLGSYVRGQLILCVAVGVAVAIGLGILRLLGVPIGNYILVLAIIAGITEFIPVLGPTIGAIPGILLGLSDSPGTALWVALVYFAVQQLENSLLVPRIIGDSVGIHPAILTVLMIAMGYLFGLVGIILAPPAAAIARDLFVYAFKRLEGLSAAQAYAAVLTQHTPPPRRAPSA
ncbi:MAG TPA: AI-2E family transporter [Roseiflexaceae bacterium]|nr:AI-2E family transporter [Roseiflexaceae bacterium]